MSEAAQFRQLFNATPEVALKPALLWWERPLDKPGPLRTALAQPETSEDRQLREEARRKEAQRRVCTPAAGVVQEAPVPRRYCVVLICKWEVDYYLEYRQEPDKTWTLVDAPAQLEAEPLRNRCGLEIRKKSSGGFILVCVTENFGSELSSEHRNC